MRTLLAAMVTAIGTQALASFELGLFGTSNLVYRYDVENHINLGSFGAGKITGLRAVVSRQATSEAFVLHAGGKGVAVFDYSTGSYKRGIGFGTPSNYNHISLTSSGDILASGAYGANQEFAVYNGQTGALMSFRTLTGGFTALDFVQMPNGYYYGLAKRPNTSTSGSFEYVLNTYSPTGTTPVNTFALGSSTVTDVHKTLISSGNQLNYVGTFNVPSKNLLTQTDGSFTEGPNWTFPFGTSGTFASAYGHANQIYTFRDYAPSSYEMLTWDPSISTYSGSYDITTLPDNLIDAHIVVAPEPGTLAAILVGSIGILRRRKKSPTSK